MFTVVGFTVMFFEPRLKFLRASAIEGTTSLGGVEVGDF